MKYLVFSDVHDMAENLSLIPKDSGLSYICLGDIVAGDPESAKSAIDTLQELDAICVYGSHDLPVVNDEALNKWLDLERMMREKGRGNPDRFRKFYEDALRVRNGLDADRLSYLESLPETQTISYGGKTVQMIHGSLPLGEEETKAIRRQMGTARIITKDVARANFESPEFNGDILLVGHSHVPVAYRQTNETIDERIFQESGKVRVHNGIFSNSKYILNPGAIQKLRAYPKHNEKTAIFERGGYRSYGILDTEEDSFEVVFV